MEQTSNLKLPYIAPSQAQKHVTHNEAIRALDALVQLSVAGRNAAEPPAEPQEGDRYIVASPASGPWTGKNNHIAAWQDGAWAFFEPQEGWYAWVMEERAFVVFSQAAWNGVKAGANPVPAVGINSIADETNRLSLKSPASLFDHAGKSHQLKINKADDDQAASLLFQSNYRGCAEMGAMWGRDFRIKTSADGDQWQDALIADSASGSVRFPGGIANTATGKKQSGLIFVPAAEMEATIYQVAGSQGVQTGKLASVASDILTFTTDAVSVFFGSAMRGKAMVRIWNVTRSPAQSAWAKWDMASNGLQVSSADHVTHWSAGDMIQIADPARKTIAIDISPMMQKLLGGVFTQDGLLLGANDAANMTVACTEPSPVSPSNLVYFREDERRAFNVIGVYG
jgi:hypothetical protein